MRTMRIAWPLILFGVQIFFCAQFPPVEDELYYWTWAKHLSPSFFDHPPFVAWLIALPTYSWFPDAPFTIRLLAPFLVAGALAAVTRLGEGHRPSLVALCPAILIFSVFMTPDVPFLFFWVVYCLWTTRPNNWALGGLILGMGLLSKYTMLLAIPCGALVLLRGRRHLLPFALHLATALLVFSPVLVFNWQHDFQPLLFQWGHQSEAGANFPEFVGVQILLWGVLPFVVLVKALGDWRLLRENTRAWAAFAFSVPPMIFFLLKALTSRLEANWPAAAFLTSFALIPFLPIRRWVRLLCFAPAALASALFLYNVAWPLPFLTPENDRYRRMDANFVLAGELGAYLNNVYRGEEVFTPSYQWASYLRFEEVNATQATWGRPSHFTLDAPDTCLRKEVLVVVSVPWADDFLKCFDVRQTLKEFPLVVRGKEIIRLRVARYSHK